MAFDDYFKTRLIGIFNNVDDAIKVRVEAEKLYGFHVNHGKREAGGV